MKTYYCPNFGVLLCLKRQIHNNKEEGVQILIELRSLDMLTNYFLSYHIIES